MANGGRARIVIVGGGFGGLHAVRALKRADADITFIDRRNHHLFQPLLYQVATAGLAPSEIAYPIRSIVRKQRNVRVILEEVAAVDTANRELRLGDGKISYDYLVLATGACDSYFSHPEWQQHAHGLKSLEDALQIRRRILLAFERAERETDAEKRRALLTIVVIGGGPTGVELSAAISEIARHVMVSDFRAIDPRDARVVLIEAGPRILPTFHESISAKAKAALERRHVEVLTSSPVTSVGATNVEAGSVRIETATIIWAAGVAATALMKSLGAPLDRSGRAIVERDLTIPGHREVFVIGDCATVAQPDGSRVPGVAPAAMQQGRHAARNIIRAMRAQPHERFVYRDKGNLATIGRASAVAEFGRLRFAGFPAWLLWLLVHIVYLIGFRNRLLVMLEWGWDYLAYANGARLITGPIEKPEAN